MSSKSNKSNTSNKSNEEVARVGNQQQLNTDIYEEMIPKDRKINIDDDSLEHQVGDMHNYDNREFTHVEGLDLDAKPPGSKQSSGQSNQ